MKKPPSSWPPRRTELATWAPAWRERWGIRANELEAQGRPWNEAEAQAHAEVAWERAALGLAVFGVPGERPPAEVASESPPEPSTTAESVEPARLRRGDRRHRATPLLPSAGQSGR